VGFLLRVLINAAAIWVAASLIPGIGLGGLGPALLAALVLGVINAIVRPILIFLTLPITLVTLGPVTGLALALRREPDLVRAKVARHIAMVGNIAARGNTTRYSEFNAWCDPEALDTVLKAGLPTELIGLDVTREAVLGPQEVSRLVHSEATNARWIHDALRFYMEFHKQADGLDGCIVNDVLPIALLLRPDALTFEEQRIVVDLSDGEHRGHTRVKPDGARVQVAMQVEMSRVRPLLTERVFRWATRATPTQTSQEGATV